MPNPFEKLAVESERDNFERQYDHPEKTTVEGEDFLIYDILPKKEKFETPVVFCPGWIEDPVNHKESTYALSKEGWRVVFPDAPHGVPAESVQGVAYAEVKKTASILKTLEEKGIVKADAIAHSEGAINLVFAATLAPEKFKNIVLVEPAGMIGKDNMGRLVLGALRDGLNAAKREKVKPPEFKLKTDIHRFLMYFVTTLPQSVREVKAISDSDIRNMLVELKKKGIGISIIHAVDDKFFPMDKVQEMTRTNQIDGFYSVKGGHMEFLTEPSRYARLASEALAALDKKQSKANK